MHGGRRGGKLGVRALTLCALALLAGCAASQFDSVVLPPVGGTPEYQLGGGYQPVPAVDIIVRDRHDQPDPDRYSICYVNGFQSQPGERELWPDDALLRVGSNYVTDPDWPDETLLDTSSASSRQRILDIVSPWISGCAEAGFDAVEFDNLDTYTRSNGALTRSDNLALATAYVRVAHSSGLAAAQKNSAEDAELLHRRAGFDFAVAEECAAYSECERYSQVYGGGVIDIEYDDSLTRAFSEVCTDPRTPESVVLRDRELLQPDDPAYVFSICD